MGERFRAVVGTGAVLCLSAGLAACSFNMSSIEDDPAETTGSLASSVRTPPRLPADLDPEDLRRAMGALALALHPQGNGLAVKWDNPESRLSGAFVPAGGPFVAADDVCRHFTATIDRPNRPTTTLNGTACKLSADEWQIRKASPV